MAGDLIPPAASPPPSVPQWLVERQREHVMTAGQNDPPSPSATSSKRPRAPPKKPPRDDPAPLPQSLRQDSRDAPATSARSSVPLSAKKSSPSVDDDLVILDLLDGAHLPTRPSPKMSKMSSNSDSIISLPPIDDHVGPRWQNLRAEAQEHRRRSRGGNSFGPGSQPPYMKAVRRPTGGPPSPRQAPAPTSQPHPTPTREPAPSPLRRDLAPSLPKREQMQTPPPRDPGLARREPPSCTLPTSVFPDRESEKPYTAVNIMQGGTAEPIRERKADAPPIPHNKSMRSLNRVRSERGLAGLAESASNEIQPLLGRVGEADRRRVTAEPGHVRRAGGGSFSISRDMFMQEDSVSTGDSSSASRSTKGRESNANERRRRRRDRADEAFRPSVWGWRMPAEEDVIMPSGAWIYLPLIGLLTFMIAFSVNSSAAMISRHAIDPVAQSIGSLAGGAKSTLWATAALRGLALATSFLFVLKVAPQYSAGSGIPEMKCVLSGVLMPRMLNWQTLLAKMVGLVFALSSRVSIGRLGPFIHMSGITAALVSKIPWFRTLRSSARFQLQALSAAMAAGVGATFGAPIGGTMLSIEVMSTYYYIHWLPMAFYCSIMGYYFVVSIVEVESHSFFSAKVNVNLELQSFQRLSTYIMLGALCGIVGAALVQFTKYVYLLRTRFFTNGTPVRTTAMVTIFAAMHTLVSAYVGGILLLEQKDGVTELFNAGHGSAGWLKDAWRPFQSPEHEHWNATIALLGAMAVKFVLTGMSLVLPVPAGTFMPIFEIGGLLGRAFGELCSGFSFVNWVDPRATAIIGAAALTSGALHTTSIAVVMLELTREALDVLPLAVGVIVSYGVSKQLCSDLFSELIKIRRLPFILGLRERYPSENHRFYEDVSSVVAGSFMSTDFPYVTPNSTKGEVFALLTSGGKPWINCAVLSDDDSRKLWGTVSQRSLWDALGNDFVGSTSDEEQGYGATGKDLRRIHKENDFISFLKNFDPAVGSPLIDMGPMQVSVHTPFWKIITLFRMLSMSIMYVVKDGKTVGCVSKAQVISYSIDIEDRAKRKRKREKKEKHAEARRQRDQKELLRQLKKDSVPSNRLASRLSEADLTICATRSGRRSRQGSISIPPR